MKNRIERIMGKEGDLQVVVKQKNTKQQSRLFCDKIEYLYRKGKRSGKPSLDHHLFFYMKGELTYKVWLKKKSYRSIDRAMEDVGFVLIPNVWDNIKTKSQKKVFIEELNEADREGEHTSSADVKKELGL